MSMRINKRRFIRSAVIGGLLILLAACGTIGYLWMAPEGEPDPSLLSSYRALVVYGATDEHSGRKLVRDIPSLEAAVRWAESSVDDVRKIRDYTCTLIKRERVGGRLVGPQYMALKVRQEPYSVYLRYLAPQAVRNQEAIYVEGRNDGKVLAHPTGLRQRLVGTVALKPTSPIAMRGNRHPITEVGLGRLVQKLAVLGRRDLDEGRDAETRSTPGVLLNGRPCTVVEVRHLRADDSVEYHLAKIFIDEQLVLPVRFEAYGPPPAAGGPLPVLEEYTYVDLKLNNGLSDADFDPANPQYGFNRGRMPELRETAQAR